MIGIFTYMCIFICILAFAVALLCGDIKPSHEFVLFLTHFIFVSLFVICACAYQHICICVGIFVFVFGLNYGSAEVGVRQARL